MPNNKKHVKWLETNRLQEKIILIDVSVLPKYQQSVGMLANIMGAGCLIFSFSTQELFALSPII